MSSMGPVNGLLINSEYIDIISSNIANASTIGYKSRNPIFFDIFSRSFYSNTTNGCGVGLLNVVQNFNNGVLIETGRDLDLGIAQAGFFRVLDSEGHIHYTRDGQFFIDKNHNIVNAQGMYLTGQNKCYSKNVFNNASILEPINLQDTRILKEKSTSTIKLKAILNRDTNLITNSEGPDNQLSATEDYTTHIDIYNKNGEKEQILISFNKKDKNTWKVNVQSDNSNNEKDINNSFDLKFDDNGELVSNKSFNIQSKNPKKYENITLDLTGTMEQSTPNNFFEEYSQDGYPQGVLQTFNIAPNGEIIGIYSNQKQQTIGQILLSKFISPEKLQPETGNVWSATAESGEEIIGIAGSDEGFGTVNQKMLEASNVDLNQELINMIIAQRNYQSNAQSFKAEDKIINTLINLR